MRQRAAADPLAELKQRMEMPLGAENFELAELNAVAERGRHFSRLELAVVRASLTLLCMARKLRLGYAGAICHVMSRGDQREAIFLPMQRLVPGNPSVSRGTAGASQ